MTVRRLDSPSSMPSSHGGDLTTYHLAHAARADFCRRLGRNTEARTSYERALSLTQQEPERRFLKRRMGELREMGE